jgi:hypothetical protein
MKKRCEFRRYDHRRRGISSSRGWLHYLGIGPPLLVGVHRGWRYKPKRGATRSHRYPRAWIEPALYLGDRPIKVYPGVRGPEQWL